MMIAAPSKPRALQVSRRTLEFMGGFVNDRNFIDMLRLLQLAVLRGNLQPEELPELPGALAEEFPSAHDIINRELVRVLVRMQVTSPIDRYFAHLDSNIPMAERIHLATHMTFLREWTGRRNRSSDCSISWRYLMALAIAFPVICRMSHTISADSCNQANRNRCCSRGNNSLARPGGHP